MTQSTHKRKPPRGIYYLRDESRQRPGQSRAIQMIFLVPLALIVIGGACGAPLLLAMQVITQPLNEGMATAVNLFVGVLFFMLMLYIGYRMLQDSILQVRREGSQEKDGSIIEGKIVRSTIEPTPYIDEEGEESTHYAYRIWYEFTTPDETTLKGTASREFDKRPAPPPPTGTRIEVRYVDADNFDIL